MTSEEVSGYISDNDMPLSAQHLGGAKYTKGKQRKYSHTRNQSHTRKQYQAKTNIASKTNLPSIKQTKQQLKDLTNKIVKTLDTRLVESGFPNEVSQNGFHYNPIESREILESNIEIPPEYHSDNEDDTTTGTLFSAHPKRASNAPLGINTVTRANVDGNIGQDKLLHVMARANSYYLKKDIGSGMRSEKGLELNYDNYKSPFIEARYLNNGNIISGVLDQVQKQYDITHNIPATTHAPQHFVYNASNTIRRKRLTKRRSTPRNTHTLKRN